jgi:hypothetical protein
VTPLLGRFMLAVTWASMREHAADPLDYWGSRGRGFKSRRPDSVRVSADQRLAGASWASLRFNLVGEHAGLEP